MIMESTELRETPKPRSYLLTTTSGDDGGPSGGRDMVTETTFAMTDGLTRYS
jgi:hypothetical protein